jgi:hypothetical protein
MRKKNRSVFHGVLIFLLMVLTENLLLAGPPFFTDDPDPVPFRHWEYYLSSENTFDLKDHSATGTLPHFEVNYGVVKNLQLHLVVPSIYLFDAPSDLFYGYTFTEFGMKYRFVKDTGMIPEVGIFPLVEIPTISNSRFGKEYLQVYLPIWIQKSWNKLTTYGGAGYWINPGSSNQNWIFTGWEVQYDFTEIITLGTEAYFHTTSSIGGNAVSGLTLGGFLNFSKFLHFIFSVGHTLTGSNQITSYAGLYITI